MPAEDVSSRKERIMNEARKVVENVNAMSFVNLNDQQVHSLMMMREIARGILCNRVEKVTKSDVKKALSSSIEKMVGSCKDVSSILSKIPCEGMDDEQTRSVSRMREIASTIVTRRAKISTNRNRALVESGNRVDADTVESKMVVATATSNRDTEIERLQRRLFETEGSEAEVDMRNEEGDNEKQDSTVDVPALLGNGDVQVGDELAITVFDGATNAVQTEGLMFKDVEVVVESEVSAENAQNEVQENVNGTAVLSINEEGQNEMQEIDKETPKVTDEDGQNEVTKTTLLSPLRLSLVWPPDGKITLDWVKDMMEKLEQSSKKDPPTEFWSLMPSSVVDNLVDAASSILSKEPNCVEVDCRGEDSKVIVVGDVEGHFHDLLNLFKLAGLPSENQFYVFNGNYVDRGAWGLEVFLVLLAWKVLMPDRVYLLRGNHETKYCTLMYGFEQEVKTKYGDQGEMVYNKCLECFKELPLASTIAGCVYTTHGGLFRSTHVGPLRRSKRKRAQNLELGSLEHLSKVNRFLIDAPQEEPSLLADVLWSDPSKEDGLIENADRRMGLSWGPDCTETFLKESKMKLIIRSHQGPDPRAGQDEFGDLLNGYSLDHEGETGKLYTLFSAPDYPQFGEPKYNNEGAYAVLKPPNFETPSFHSFKAVERPKLALYGSSSSEAIIPRWKRAKVEFEALGISYPPSWSVELVDNASDSKVVQVPRAPMVEGLPLPSDLPEAQKAMFEYLFELVAGLKHMLSTRVIESGVPESTEEASVPNENGGSVPNGNEGSALNENEGSVPNVNEGIVLNLNEGSVPNENKGQDNEVEIKTSKNEGRGNEVELKTSESKVQGNVAEMKTSENEGQGNDAEMKTSENEGQGNDVETKTSENERQDNEFETKTSENEGQDNEFKMKTSENEGQDNEVEMKTSENEFKMKTSENEFKMKTSENEGQDNEVEMKTEKKGQDNEVEMKTSENEGQDNEVEMKTSENEGQDNEGKMKTSENKGQDNEGKMKPSENEGKGNEVEKPSEKKG